MKQTTDNRNKTVLEAIRAYEKEMSGNDIDYKITDIIQLTEGADMYQFEADGIYSSAIRHADGTIFFLADWQGNRPTTFEEISDFLWITLYGRYASMINGLPRAF